MSTSEGRKPCMGCGALVPDVHGPTHRYIGASPGCWAIYGEILAREYSDFRYARRHRLTVDAYAAQHPGTSSPQSIQSVAVHLISLYLSLEKGCPPERAIQAMGRATSRKAEFVWLEPPPSVGKITVIDVHRVGAPKEHLEQVLKWAECVWDSWSERRPTVRSWAGV